MHAEAEATILRASDQVSDFHHIFKRLTDRSIALRFRLLFDMSIVGLPNRARQTAQISDADCPIELDPTAA